MGAFSAAAQFAALVLVLGVLHKPLGDYMAHVYTSGRHLRAERAVYRVIGVNPDAVQTWRSYLRAVVGFSLIGLLVLYALLRLQQFLPASLGMEPMDPALAFNTAASFVTNTNWQAYSGESALGYTAQMAGLAVQNFASAAVGLCIAVALIRGFTAKATGTLGNFWVDLTRSIFRLLLPLAFMAALGLLAGGVIQNFNDPLAVHTLTGQLQSIPGGPVASQEAIKLLGTNGGGFFNANSAHPFENPSPITNFAEIVLMLLIPFSLPRTLGTMLGSAKQGYAVLAAMGALFTVSFVLLALAEHSTAGTATAAAGAAMEGKEVRFGIPGTVLFATTSTGTSTGAVNAAHDSFTALGGMLPMLNMMLGEIAPGGVGSGLYGMLVIAILAVFIGSLLIGRTAQLFGKKIGPTQIKLVALYILVTPALILGGLAVSLAIPGARDSVLDSRANSGPHGLSELIYAFTSAANNNGSAFAGLSADTPWLNTVLGLAMLIGRFAPIVLVLALAGSLATSAPAAEHGSMLPTHRPQFVGLLLGAGLLTTVLTYFPVLALGPLAEGLG
ncbi:potassium-transporting ATPase subunit A [Arthrobacter sp. YC-RL1]|uniref:potassium-transporting ATPase subunit KdpA n=1 Tax=Arthrobacter sp. YC-RL1 TaxID=1652545 RepID=UPI00063D979F|nr:potassium-transporting ATPase subunit KdpA [Arthrobacter sp. YC-RL1]ALQ32560.1 potassium-transporting ATPase subunit A [Arthrobacter sp. YC-RL1]KLI90563.1 potassium-transporting ATPase subunit A [Arthrobacter sp. YC-RL1]